MKFLIPFLIVFNVFASECTIETTTQRAYGFLDDSCDWQNAKCETLYSIKESKFKNVFNDISLVACTVKAEMENLNLIARSDSLSKGHKVTFKFTDLLSKAKGKVVWINKNYNIWYIE